MLRSPRNPIGLYCVVDFQEGRQCIPSNWLNEERSIAYWPPWADTIDQVRFDKNVRKRLQPDENWTQEEVMKIRSHGDDCDRVRGKLKEAALNSDTNLDTSCDEDGNRRLGKRKSRPPKRLYENGNSDDDAEDSEQQGPEPPSSPTKRKANAQNKQRSSTAASAQEPLKSFSSAILPVLSTAAASASQQASQLSKITQAAQLSKPKQASQPPKPSTPSQSALERMQDSIRTLSPISPRRINPSRLSKAASPYGTTPDHVRSLFGNSPEKSSPVIPSPREERNDRSTVTAPTSRTNYVSDEDFKRLVLVNLKSLRTQQMKMANDIAKLLKKRPTAPLVDGDEVDSSAEAELAGLPAVEIDELLDFDSKLKDANYKNKVVATLKQMGGTTLGAVVRNILNRVMSDSVADLYSFQGGKGKKRFDELNFKSVLFRSVRANSPYKEAKDEQIKDAVCKWLANAKTRLNKKKPSSSRPQNERWVATESDTE